MIVPPAPREKPAELQPSVSQKRQPPAKPPTETRTETHTDAKETAASAPRAKARTLKPVPRATRTDHVPPLPPDAFEILSTPIDP